jgi:hypothetical protein
VEHFHLIFSGFRVLVTSRPRTGAKAKDLDKDNTRKAKAQAKDFTHKAKAKDLKCVLKDRSRPRTNITGNNG